MLIYTSTQLLESVRNLGGCGDTRSTGNRDADILRHINEALREKILPEFSILREDYFVQRSRSTLINGRARIDPRASWNKLRDLYYRTSAGEGPQQLDALQMDEVHDYGVTGGPYGYYIEGNDIVLVGSAPVGSVLEQAFIFRPGDVVPVEDTRRVISVDPVTSTVVLDSAVPVDWLVTDLFDVHSPESGAEIIDWSIPVVSILLDTIVFGGAIDGSLFGRKALAVGQFVVKEGSSAVPGIPREWIPLLVRSTAARLSEAIADEMSVKMHGTVSEGMLRLNKQNAEQRIESKPMRVGGRRGALRAMRGW